MHTQTSHTHRGRLVHVGRETHGVRLSMQLMRRLRHVQQALLRVLIRGCLFLYRQQWGVRLAQDWWVEAYACCGSVAVWQRGHVAGAQPHPQQGAAGQPPIGAMWQPPQPCPQPLPQPQPPPQPPLAYSLLS